MTKFNFTRGTKTKKGKPPVVRGISPDHTIYPIYFDEYGRKRSPEEVEKILADIRAIAENNLQTN